MQSVGDGREYLANIGAWRSMVAHTVRDREVAGSNPVAPTNLNIANFAGSLFA